MFYTASVYLALAVFLLGTLYRISSWFRHGVGIEAQGTSTGGRLAAALKGATSTLLSPRILILLKVFLVDGILQVRLLRRDFTRWLGHICIYGGFMLLLLMHALSSFTTSALFADYSPTLNPFMFLRDFSAAVLVTGLVLACYRRFVRKTSRPPTNRADITAMALLGVVVVSGVGLESVKILSSGVFQSMVTEYVVAPDEASTKSLEAYWVREFGVVSPRGAELSFDSRTLDEGKSIHDMSCRQCHSSPQWAFAGYGLSRLVSPLALQLERANARDILWYFHFLASLIGLALLPFTKIFHVITGPMSLMLNAVMTKETSDPANIATRQCIELDACTHCGACTLDCMVAVVYQEIPNANILPSEKIDSLKALAAGKVLSDSQLRNIQEGMFICTNCNRCTVACPVGISLRDLWVSVREGLLTRSLPEFFLLSPLSLYRGLMQMQTAEGEFQRPPDLAREAVAAPCDLERVKDLNAHWESGGKDLLVALNSPLSSLSYSDCYRCKTCSNVCPVVRMYPRPTDVLGLMPHQIMHAVGLRLWDLVLSSRMLWDCLGCYQCQESCPQNVCVADTLYALKNLAVAQANKKLKGEKGGKAP